MTTSPTLSNESVPAAGKRFAQVMPLAFITYSLAYLDRVNISFGGAGDMRGTLGLSENQFALFSASFFIGYVLFQIPGASYAARGNVRKLMFWSLWCWGIIASATAVLHHYYLLLLDRFLLGAVEGLVFPSLLVFLTDWFTRRERSRANTFLILGNPITLMWANVASGALVAWFDMPSHVLWGMRGWQTMLLAEGMPTLLWAGIWWMLARDRPQDAAWLEPTEAAAVSAALAAEQLHVKHVRDYWAAFADPQVILLCLQFFMWSVGAYGLNMWLPIITKEGSKMGIGHVGLWTAIPYVFGAIVMLIVSILADRSLVRKPFVWSFLLLGSAAFLFSYLAGPNHFWISFIGLVVAGVCIYAPYGPYWAMIPEMVSRNVIGESMALINTVGAAGGFVGTFGVGRLHHYTGGYGASFACLSACMAMGGILTLFVHVRQGRETETGSQLGKN